MAKPRTPKKNATVNESVTPTNPVPVAETAAPVQTAVAESEAMNTAPRRTSKRPEIVKTEPRANVVPINLEDEIRRLAYLYSERRGFEPGHEGEDWLAAEREVLQRYHQHSA